VTCYTEGFSHFVTSMTAPVASGWSGRRVGLAPTGKRRLLTAHTLCGHCGLRPWTSQWGVSRHSPRQSRAGCAAFTPQASPPCAARRFAGFENRRRPDRCADQHAGPETPSTRQLSSSRRGQEEAPGSAEALHGRPLHGRSKRAPR
jgi:hypothetical protein